ncbi:hypothetical protein C2845_PM14G11480, partial [Panicum miliaceum]
LGRLPVELAALKDCMEEVELLFPLTSPVPGVPNWSVDGVISHAKLKNAKPLEERQIARRKAMLKSLASNAFKQKDYDTASKFYGSAIDHEPDATLYSNRSVCRLRENSQACIALLDAQKLDPGNEEIERELRKAMALRDASRDGDQQGSGPSDFNQHV